MGQCVVGTCVGRAHRASHQLRAGWCWVAGAQAGGRGVDRTCGLKGTSLFLNFGSFLIP